jgi:hypothetical protein
VISGAERACRSVVSEERTEGASQNGIESLVLRYALLDSWATAPEAVVIAAKRACRAVLPVMATGPDRYGSLQKHRQVRARIGVKSFRGRGR